MRSASWSFVTLALVAGSVEGARSAEASRPPAVCFAPGTDPEYVARTYASVGAEISLAPQPESFQFNIANRWGGSSLQGQPIVLTWSVIPDGTNIPAAGIPGEVTSPSNLRARLNAIYGSQAVWQPIFQQMFDAWGALTGTSYQFVNDDGAAFPGSAGSSARGDVRIGGHHLDGNFNVLAYNYFPNVGDMVIDTNDSFYTNTANGSLGLRNVLAHEHGHGLGISHVCPVTQTKLMEPFLTTAFTGPQHDDIQAGQRGYGDDRENDDTTATGTDFGTVGNGTFTSNGGSLDDNADNDFIRFTVPAGKRLAVTLTPIGFTYNQGPQNATTGACDLPTPPFNSLVSNDVGVQVLAPNGTTVLATANSQPAGQPETIPAFELSAAGQYFIRVFGGSADTVQLYNLSFTVEPGGGPFLFMGDGTATEGDAGTSTAVFTVSLNIAAAVPVTVNFSTADDTAAAPADYLAATGTVTFPPGSLSQTVSVAVVGDESDEPDETFFVNLSGAVGVGIADSQGVGTIVDDDVESVSIGDVTVTEGDSGPAVASFTASLTAASTQSITVDFATTNGTALAPGDYAAALGTITFPPATTTRAVSVQVEGDQADESTETFLVNLTNPVNALITDGQGVGTILDDDSPVVSELSHGYRASGTLAAGGGAADRDTFAIGQRPFASYEVVVDATSGDITPVRLERIDAGGTTIQSGEPVGTGQSTSLRWINATSSTINSEAVRVLSGDCTTQCGADDVYAIRSYETTYTVSRFNNTGTQVTVLLLQNPADYTIAGTVYFWDGQGVLAAAQPFTLAARRVLVLGTAAVAPNIGGSITIANDGRFGDLTGKAVALEPATGFSFDSTMEPRRR